MTLRWYGSKFDTVTLKQIRQIPGVKGVITMLYDIPAGEVWPLDRILELKAEVEAADLKILGIESVNVHDAIKIGSPDREKYIANYIPAWRTGQGRHHHCLLHFMPVFDWTVPTLPRCAATVPHARQ